MYNPLRLFSDGCGCPTSSSGTPVPALAFREGGPSWGPTSSSGTPVPALSFGGGGFSQVCSQHSMAPQVMRRRAHWMRRDPADFWCMVEEASSYSGMRGPRWDDPHT